RFLLEHVPDPLAVVRNMVRAVRVCGRVVLEDDDHGTMRLWAEPPGFGPLWEGYICVCDRLGNDPGIGRRLVWRLHQGGAVAGAEYVAVLRELRGTSAFRSVH